MRTFEVQFVTNDTLLLNRFENWFETDFETGLIQGTLRLRSVPQTLLLLGLGLLSIVKFKSYSYQCLESRVFKPFKKIIIFKIIIV